MLGSHIALVKRKREEESLFQVRLEHQTIHIAAAHEVESIERPGAVIDVRVYEQPHPRTPTATMWAPRGAAAAIDAALRSHDEIYVHCERGLSRSPVAVALFLVRHRDHSVEAASKAVRRALGGARHSLDPLFDASLRSAIRG